MAHNFKMTRALNGASLFVSVYDVERGLACNCTCIDCGSRLVAKKGEFKAEHFAHSPDDAKAKLCKWSYETDLHIIAKEVIRKSKTLSIPLGLNEYQTMVLNFDDVEEEQTLDESRLRPDITAVYEGETIHVEIAVSNPCDKDKVISLRKQNLNVLEVYLDDFAPSSDIITFEEVEKHIAQAHKKWLCICPSGYIGSLINEHEKAYLRNLMTERQRILLEVVEAKKELAEMDGKLKQKKVTHAENEMYREKLHHQNEVYKAQLNQESENLKEEVYWLHQSKSKLIQEAEYKSEQIRTQAHNAAQAQFNSEKDYLKQQYFAQLEFDKKAIDKNLIQTKQSLLQYQADLEKVKVELESSANKLKILESSESLFLERESSLSQRECAIQEAKKVLSKREVRFQTLAHNLTRITPELRKITSRHGMAFPFDENIINELNKPIR